MIAAFALALFSVAPSVQPPITVDVTDTKCGEVTINVSAPAGTWLRGSDDLGSVAPWQHASAVRPVELLVYRDPGTVISWGIARTSDNFPTVTGTHVVPPCISAPEVPVQLIPAVRIEREPKRARVLDRWVLLMVRGVR